MRLQAESARAASCGGVRQHAQPTSRTQTGLEESLRHEEEKNGQNNVEHAPHFLYIYMCAIDMCGGKAEFIHFAPRVLTASRRRSGSAQQPKCDIFSFSLEVATGHWPGAEAAESQTLEEGRRVTYPSMSHVNMSVGTRASCQGYIPSSHGTIRPSSPPQAHCNYLLSRCAICCFQP